MVYYYGIFIILLFNMEIRQAYGSGGLEIGKTQFCSTDDEKLSKITEIDESLVDGPLLPCQFLHELEEFYECDLAEKVQNASRSEESGAENKGRCLKFGGNRYEAVEWTNVTCRVLPCVDCYGPRTFLKQVPCIKYTGHYFLTTLLYSIFLGFVAVDRFCLGYTAIGVGKLMTLGGLGVWWIIDVVLLVSGRLMPKDESNWEPFF